jgi:hypothetical protein
MRTGVAIQTSNYDWDNVHLIRIYHLKYSRITPAKNIFIIGIVNIIGQLDTWKCNTKVWIRYSNIEDSSQKLNNRDPACSRERFSK